MRHKQKTRKWTQNWPPGVTRVQVVFHKTWHVVENCSLLTSGKWQWFSRTPCTLQGVRLSTAPAWSSKRWQFVISICKADLKHVNLPFVKFWAQKGRIRDKEGALVIFELCCQARTALEPRKSKEQAIASTLSLKINPINSVYFMILNPLLSFKGTQSGRQNFQFFKPFLLWSSSI